jgi:hypothetical protein
MSSSSRVISFCTSGTYVASEVHSQSDSDERCADSKSNMLSASPGSLRSAIPTRSGRLTSRRLTVTASSEWSRLEILSATLFRFQDSARETTQPAPVFRYAIQHYGSAISRLRGADGMSKRRRVIRQSLAASRCGWDAFT